jgi:hypothetical protein
MRIPRVSAYFSSFFLLIAILSQAECQAPKPDPKVQALFDLAYATYKSLPAYHVKVSFKYQPDNRLLFGGEGQPLSMDLKLQRPNKLSVSYVIRQVELKTTGEGKASKDEYVTKTVRYQTVCDGKDVYRWSGGTNSYTKAKAGPSFPDLPPSLNLPELPIFLRALDPLKTLAIPANLLTVGKPEKLGDLDVDVIGGKVSEPGLYYTAKLRIQMSQKDHTFRGVQLDGEGRDPIDKKPLTFKIEAIYDQVVTAPMLAAADFTFTPPAGSREEQPAVKAPGQ